jgi:cell wall-associated NlpC family hydrolase
MIAQPGYIIRVFSLAITVLALAACGSNPPAQAPVDRHSAGQPVASPVRSTAGQRAAAIALDQVGVPYRYGGTTPGGFDCSGLVQYSYKQAGLNVPRTTGQLWSAASPVGRSELKAGDLLFFRIEGKMSHVGLYLGERRFVHAPQSGRKVSVESLDSPFYKGALIRAGRPY